MKDILALIWGIAVLALMGVFLLHSNISTDNTDIVEYIVQSEGSYTSYEVEHTVSGYKGSIYESTTYDLTDEEKQELFNIYREQEDWKAEYQEARNLAESDSADDYIEAEEDRIEEYCDEYGYESCYNIQYT
ncbi:hypothetical protein COV16_00950, partial [Candidatus Woesearchaeota archaeon CG10_big_fil_rev_8_21_14_0_10_34_8]